MEELSIRRNNATGGSGNNVIASCPYGIGFPLLGQPPLPWMPYLAPTNPTMWSQPPDAEILASLASTSIRDVDNVSVTSSSRALSPSEPSVSSTTATSIQEEKSVEDSILVRPQPVIPTGASLAVPFDPLVTIQALEANPVINRAISSRLTRRPRSEKRPIPEDMKDEKYYERRKRNNLAAKKSRDARKAREDQIAFRACLLEKENAVLRAQVTILREEGYWLRQLLSQRRPQRP